MKGLEWLKEEVQELLLQDKLNGINYFDYKRLKEDIWGKIDQIEQPELPVISEFLAQYIEKCKAKGLPLFSAMEYSYEENDKVARYLFDNTTEIKTNNQILFVRAWLDGYTIEEKKYVIKTEIGTYLIWNTKDRNWDYTGLPVDASSIKYATTFKDKKEAEAIAYLLGNKVKELKK